MKQLPTHKLKRVAKLFASLMVRLKDTNKVFKERQSLYYQEEGEEEKEERKEGENQEERKKEVILDENEFDFSIEDIITLYDEHIQKEGKEERENDYDEQIQNEENESSDIKTSSLSSPFLENAYYHDNPLLLFLSDYIESSSLFAIQNPHRAMNQKYDQAEQDSDHDALNTVESQVISFYIDSVLFVRKCLGFDSLQMSDSEEDEEELEEAMWAGRQQVGSEIIRL